MNRGYDKWIVHTIKQYNVDELEECLSKMAQQGFFLIEMNDYQMFFRKGTPGKLRYSLVYVPNKESHMFYKEHGRKFGWDHVCEIKDFMIFSTKDMTIPSIESDESIFENIQMLREKQTTIDGIMLGLLLIVASLVWYNIGLAVVALSAIGFGLILMGVVYGSFLLVRCIDTIFWMKESKRRLQSGEKLSFQYAKVTRSLDRIVKSLTLIIYVIFVVYSCYRLGWYIQEEGIQKIKFTILSNGMLLVAIVFGSVVRKELKEKGAYITLLLKLLFIVSLTVVTIAMVKGFSYKEPTYPFQSFGYNINPNNCYEDIYVNSSILGSKEHYSCLTSGTKVADSFSYAYYIYKTNFSGLQPIVNWEVLHVDHLNKYLKLYQEGSDYKVYTAINKKVYSPDAEVVTFNSELESNDGCVVVQKKKEILVFYYSGFLNRGVDDILEDLNVK